MLDSIYHIMLRYDIKIVMDVIAYCYMTTIKDLHRLAEISFQWL